MTALKEKCEVCLPRTSMFPEEDEDKLKAKSVPGQWAESSFLEYFITYIHTYVHCSLVAITTPEGGSWGYLSLQITHPAQERLATPPGSTFPTFPHCSQESSFNTWVTTILDKSSWESNFTEHTCSSAFHSVLFHVKLKRFSSRQEKISPVSPIQCWQVKQRITTEILNFFQHCTRDGG